MFVCDLYLSGNVGVSSKGESCPVTKTALPVGSEALYVPAKFKHHTLYGGTSIIQTRFYSDSHVLALVVTTGNGDTVGSLVVKLVLFLKSFCNG